MPDSLPPRPLPALLEGRSTLLVSAIVCAAYVAAGGLGLWLLHHAVVPRVASVAPTVGIPWPAVGVGVAGVMLLGTRAIWGVLAGSFILWGVLQGDQWPVAAADAAGESVSILVIVWLLRAWDYRPSLERYQDALILIAAAMVGRTISSALDIAITIGAAWTNKSEYYSEAIALAGVVRQGDTLVMSPALLWFAVRWWANSAVGVLLVVPLLAFRSGPGERRTAGSGAERLVWTGVATIWLAAALTLPGTSARLTVLAAAVTLVVWAARRFGVALASLATLAFTMTATLGFAFRLGVFAGIAGPEGLEVIWGFLGILSGAGLFLTALVAGRERAERRLASNLERYRRLFLVNPSPMWAEDLASGRILVVNEAALEAYGYSEDAFLRLRRADIEAPAEASADGHGATHRAASGELLDVEVSTVDVELSGLPVRMWFVDLVSERNDLRIAVLNAADLEQQRLSQEIRDGLGPVLSRLQESIDELVGSLEQRQRVEPARLAAIEQDAAAATAICRQLSRGASPIHFASNDLIAALRRLPELMAGPGRPAVEVSVRAFAPLSLSLERCEHVYRMTQEAVRSALLRRGARFAHVAVDVTPESVDVTVEDDGVMQETEGPEESPASSPVAVRAAAARARLDLEPRTGGGQRLRIECRQNLGPPRIATTSSTVAAITSMPASVSEATGPAGVDGSRTAASGGGRWRTWLDGLLLMFAYVGTGTVGLHFLSSIGQGHVSFVPPMAVPWMANGVAVVGLMLGGKRLAPAVFLASIVLWGLVARDPWMTVFADALGETLCALLVVTLLHRWSFRREFDRFRDPVLLVLAAVAGRAVATVADAAGGYLALLLTPASINRAEVAAVSTSVTVGLRWFASGVGGIALLVPVILPLSKEAVSLVRARWREALALAVAVGGLGFVIATGPAASWRVPLLGASLMLVAWSAVDFRGPMAAATTLALSLAAAAGHGLGSGPIAASEPSEGSEVLWGFIALLSATGFFLTVTVVRFEQTLEELRNLTARYAALFEAIPRPLFAWRATTGRITMANAAAQRRYGYSNDEIVGMTPGELAAGRLATATATPSYAPLDRAGVHRTRTGETFEVELTVTPVDFGAETENLCVAMDVTERNELRRRVLEAADVERRRLAQELHDGLGQILTGLALGIGSVRRDVEREGRPTPGGLSFVRSTMSEATRTCDGILAGLSPLQATGGNLVAALQNFSALVPPSAREQITVDIRASSDIRLPLVRREHLYQIAREAVNNALKHAQASRILVTLSVTANTVTLVVEDDGIGFDPVAVSPSGLGLQSLALRSTAVHGRLAVERRAGGGTAVTCRCPQLAA